MSMPYSLFITVSKSKLENLSSVYSIMFTGSHQDILFPPNISAKCCGAQPSPAKVLAAMGPLRQFHLAGRGWAAVWAMAVNTSQPSYPPAKPIMGT